jgi:thiol-disulfide isomerase/thioredoxin
MLLLASCSKPQADPPAAPAAAFKAEAMEGMGEVNLEALKGKVVLLNFWATWCPPCRAEIPDLVGLDETYRDKGLAIVGVSVDISTAEVVGVFLRYNRMSYPNILDSDDRLAALYGGIHSIPKTFLIDKKGRIRETWTGSRSREVFEAAIKPLLDES